MKLKLHAINFALFCWVAALTGKLIHYVVLTRAAATLTIIGLIIHILINKNRHMFKLKNTKNTHYKEPPTTIIANNVCIEGDINSNEETVHIFGKLKGNIFVTNGRIKIFDSGIVDGVISCNYLIVNGVFNGDCVCESIEIEENGEINGTINYHYLTIKKGGSFSGCANKQNEKEHSTIQVTTSITEEKTFNDE